MSHHLHRRCDDPSQPPEAPPPPITPEQLDFFTEQTEHAARKAAARALRGAARAYVVIVVALIVLTAWYVRDQSKDEAHARAASVKLVQDATTGSCQRVNVLRAQSNLGDFVIFKILSDAGRRELALVKGDPDNRKIHKASARTFISQARRVTITGMTDCKAAVASPLTYKVPLAAPIGDPATGEVFLYIKKIVAASEATLENAKP